MTKTGHNNYRFAIKNGGPLPAFNERTHIRLLVSEVIEERRRTSNVSERVERDLDKKYG